ncbi:hypothetical protein C8R47DRAFT_215704 [Mycena vitilis]|nr:hypothetical protein C8R47DRAFT_215704 [Mycena vitilis]
MMKALFMNGKSTCRVEYKHSVIKPDKARWLLPQNFVSRSISVKVQQMMYAVIPGGDQSPAADCSRPILPQLLGLPHVQVHQSPRMLMQRSSLNLSATPSGSRMNPPTATVRRARSRRICWTNTSQHHGLDLPRQSSTTGSDSLVSSLEAVDTPSTSPGAPGYAANGSLEGLENARPHSGSDHYARVLHYPNSYGHPSQTDSTYADSTDLSLPTAPYRESLIVEQQPLNDWGRRQTTMLGVFGVLPSKGSRNSHCTSALSSTPSNAHLSHEHIENCLVLSTTFVQSTGLGSWFKSCIGLNTNLVADGPRLRRITVFLWS